MALLDFLKTKEISSYGGEVATAVDDLYKRWQLYPYNPDQLAAKKGGLKIYQDMRRDDQIKACLQLKKAAVTTPGWEVEGEKEEHIDFLNYVFDQMEGTVEGFIHSVLSAFEYGFSVHEKVYSYIDTGKFSGKIGLKNLKAKSPTRLDFRTDEYGNLLKNGLVQRQESGVLTPLPIDKFVIYTYQQEFDNFYGESDLRSIYRLWFVKVNVIKYWAIYLERFSIPIVKGRTLTGRVTEQQREDFKTLIQNVQAGMSVILPQDLSMDLLESTRVDRGVFDQAVNALNVGIARGILIPQLLGLVPQEGVGSYGKGEIDLRTFDWVLGSLTKNLEDTINEQILRQLIEINYGVQENYPYFKIRPMKEEDKARMVASWSEAVARGAAVPTLDTEKYVRELLGFPELSPEDEKKVEDALKNAQAAPQSGLAGGPSKTSNLPGKQNQYSVRLLPGPESRVEWEKYVNDLDEIEDEAKRELTEAFSYSIMEMIKDAKKNSRARNG